MGALLTLDRADAATSSQSPPETSRWRLYGKTRCRCDPVQDSRLSESPPLSRKSNYIGHAQPACCTASLPLTACAGFRSAVINANASQPEPLELG